MLTFYRVKKITAAKNAAAVINTKQNIYAVWYKVGGSQVFKIVS
jgi:hypothetical protein